MDLNYCLAKRQIGVGNIRSNVFVSNILLSIKPGLHEPQLPVEWNLTLVSSIVVERRCLT